MRTGSYADFKRHQLVYGSDSRREFVPIPLPPSLCRDQTEAVALEKMLAAERAEAKAAAHARHQQAAIAVEARLLRRRAALGVLQRWCRRWLHALHARQCRMAARIARWYRQEASRRRAALHELCLRLEAMRGSYSAPGSRKVEARVWPAAAERTLTLQVLSLRHLVSPIPPLACLHSSMHVEMQLLHKSTGERTSYSMHPVMYSESTVEWSCENAVVVVADDINDWVGSVKVLHVTLDGPPRTIGHVQVPVDLLNSPLATSLHCLRRWFPLEKMAPKDLVRGEVRIELTYAAPVSSPEPSPLAVPKKPVKPKSPTRKVRRIPPTSPPLRSPLKGTRVVDAPPPPDVGGASMPPPAPRAKQPYLKRKPYKVQFEQLDWSNVGAKTNSNLAKPKRTKPAHTEKPSNNCAPGLNLELQSLATTSAVNPSNMKLELMQLKQKTELQTIFHLVPSKKAPGRIPTLSKSQIQQVQGLPTAQYAALVATLDRDYGQLKQQWQDNMAKL
ncbi:hypothetical protein SDRG_03705 [Saprolegnia diclina VS20]|uniref:C2 domain-containing protein n=1 Tax=Saprolegnia diclina (strain VS20) TaxID=1156394 RepID=T0QVN2_SAPDV|nr:hypothetical protein SDRG_03705 [Saprolegnia diclina VS20]EQC38741.1 hypothetical protein SDRG_03705 [Saprolegnia diclina VS20]|eukprot:XP_008607565.1 hypothetical protein SDRG_03705 [Saprolegnia diclina VS20]